jgi:hypothetical protein
LRVPFAAAVLQPTPSPEISTLPSMFRQDDVAFQVPTMVPPQGVTFEHDAVGVPPVPTPVPAVPVAGVPAVGAAPAVPFEVPAAPGGGSEVTLQAPENTVSAVAVAIAKAAVWIFMKGLFSGAACVAVNGSRRWAAKTDACNDGALTCNCRASKDPLPTS